MKIIIATIKSWNIERAYAMQKQYEGIHEIRIFTKKEDLTRRLYQNSNRIISFCPTGLICSQGR